MNSAIISATEPDWQREKTIPGCYEPAKYLLRAIRGYQQAVKRGGITGKLAKPFHVLHHRFWSAVSGADIPINSKIAGGLLMPHPNGIVMHPAAEIGPNCLIFQQVTIGTGGSIPGTPRIGGHVDIGAGAKILGGVIIGAHARIGANSVVIADVPEHSTAAGIPAKIVRKNDTP